MQFAIRCAGVGFLLALSAPVRPASAAGADELLNATGLKGGLIVHVGCADGKRTAALRTLDSFVVHGLDTDAAAVTQARRHICDLGLYGPVSVNRFDGKRLPYADNLVNLLVMEGAPAGMRNPGSEIARVLSPRGMAIVRGEGNATWLSSISYPAAPIGDGFVMFTKPVPPEMDDWTHWLHAADGNPVAQDTVVGPPRRMQWFAKPLWSRSHEKSPSLTGMVSAKGRLFYILDEGPVSIGGPLPDKWQLVARDAFSGIALWKRPVPDWGYKAWSPNQPMNLRWGNPRFIHRRLVAVDDRVYVTLGYSAPITALDAATGNTIRVYEGTENTGEILYHEGLLVLSVATQPKSSIKGAPLTSVMAIEAATAKPLWTAGPFPSLYDLGERGKSNVLKQGRLVIAAGGDHVYCVTQKEILALQLGDGQTAWSAPRPATVSATAGSKAPVADSKRFAHLGALVYHNGHVFFTQPHVPSRKLVDYSPMTLVCLSATTGKQMWRKACADWSYTTCLNVYAARNLIWAHADAAEGKYNLLGMEPTTGKVKVRHNLKPILMTSHHHRCYRNRATENYLLMGKEGVEFVDLTTGALQPHRWLRGMCLYGVMPANGLLYVPPQACSCNPMTMLQGYWALAPDSQPTKESGEQSVKATGPGERLERGPALDDSDSPLLALRSPLSTDWPMYRRDSQRRAASEVTVDARLDESWTATVGGKLTAPVVAGGRVFLGSRETHELLALNAATGAEIWRSGAGGDIDTPPTVYHDMVLAGCADGWVYCLRASDGQRIWRFRAAPQERYVVAENRVESAWPVHGSVLIQNDIAYVTAGRAAFLDGGIRMYMLEPKTGNVLREKTFFTKHIRQEDRVEGVTSDLLVSDGETLFLRHIRIDPATLALTRLGTWGAHGPGSKWNDSPDEKSYGLPVSNESYTYLRSGQGFLDDSLFGRTQFHLDGGEACHLLSFNDQRCYGFQMSTHPGHHVFFTPGAKGYSIVCFDREPKKEGKDRKLWERKLSLRAYAMVLAGDRLFVSGVPDRAPDSDPLAAFEGRLGAELVALSGSDGTPLSKMPLKSPPVFDGLIAAGGQLFMSTQDGHVLCLD